jgi:hypothetical protein
MRLLVVAVVAAVVVAALAALGDATPEVHAYHRWPRCFYEAC